MLDNMHGDVTHSPVRLNAAAGRLLGSAPQERVLGADGGRERPEGEEAWQQLCARQQAVHLLTQGGGGARS